MAHIDSINHGNAVLWSIVSGIHQSNDTEEWTDVDWQKALQDEIEIVGEREPGDVKDLVAYVIDYYDGDVTATANIGMYGFASVIADVIYSAGLEGETCDLLD